MVTLSNPDQSWLTTRQRSLQCRPRDRIEVFYGCFHFLLLACCFLQSRHSTFTWMAPTKNASMRNCPKTPWLLVQMTFAPFSQAILITSTGSYKAEAYNTQTQSFNPTSDLQILLTVDETFDNDHRVVKQTTTSSPSWTRLTFTAGSSGIHRICFTPSGPAAISVGGWFSGGGQGVIGGVKLYLDLAIGATSLIESDDKDKMESIVGKVNDLNGRLQDVRREQVFQRVSEQRRILIAGQKLTYWVIRNEKPSSATKARLQTQRSCDGL
jgi:emp24/gp25L/p24 family/GOLD